MAEPWTKASTYRSLKTAESIRLLRLCENNGGSPSSVRAEMTTFSLTGPDCPPFTTISYTWGDEYSDVPIDLDGQAVRVLKSVRPLLEMLSANSCAEFDARKDWFWIDSICINQSDISERASQVKLMGQIYRQAAQTIVWLGRQTESTDQAMDFLSALEARRHDLRHAANLRRRKMQAGQKMPSDLEGHPGWKSLEQLLENPWWRRVWTLQEYLLPPELRFYCGTKSLSRRTFRRGMDALELCYPQESCIDSSVWTTAWNRRRVGDWYRFDDSRQRMSLVSLMAFCGDYGVTDARDRIWGVHGLAREEDKQMIGDPTYRPDVKTLYVDLVKNFVDRYSSLDIICYSQLFASPDPDWPSWVPDWRVSSPKPPVVPLLVSQSANENLANFRPITTTSSKRKKQVAYRASGTKAPSIQFSDPVLYCTCQGLLLDSVDGLGPMEGELVPAVESTSPVNTKPADTQEKESLMYSLARSLVFDRMDKFLETRAPTQQYARELRLLVAACGQQVGDGPPRAGFWFSKWWEEVNRDPVLRMRGFTVKELCGVEDHAFHPSQPIPRASKSFFSRFRGTMKAKSRRLVVTNTGCVGLGPSKAQKGDAVCILFGCSVPVVLRRLDQSQVRGGRPTFRFIGECYLDGFMDGEGLELGKETEEFVIR